MSGRDGECYRLPHFCSFGILCTCALGDVPLKPDCPVFEMAAAVDATLPLQSCALLSHQRCSVSKF